jgi:hypothetical protein
MGPRLRLPRYVHAFVDRHGKARFYFRRTGFKQHPLPGLPYSPEFMTAYEAACGGETAPRAEIGIRRSKPGTVAAYCRILVLGQLRRSGADDAYHPAPTP